MVKTTNENGRDAKMVAAIKKLAQSQRAVAHVLSRTVHPCPETGELRDFVEKQVAEALNVLGVEE